MKPSAHLGSILTLPMSLFLAACSTALLHPVTYRARIEHIDIPAGEFLSLEKGCQPMTHLYLRVLPSGRGEEAAPLRVSVLGWYLPEALGGNGDTVTFEYPGPLPRAGQVAFAELFDYRLVTAR